MSAEIITNDSLDAAIAYATELLDAEVAKFEAETGEGYPTLERFSEMIAHNMQECDCIPVSIDVEYGTWRLSHITGRHPRTLDAIYVWHPKRKTK